MDIAQIDKIITQICNKLKLGDLLEKPLRVQGGLMHKMYCIKTNSGMFAVKLLNQKIMQRDDALENFKVAESLELKLEKSDIPAVVALQFNGTKMQQIDNQYYYVFTWVDGKSMNSEKITKEHCLQIASILAKIHKIDSKNESSFKEAILIDWNNYIKLAKAECPEIASLLNDCIHIIYKSQNDGNDAYDKLPKMTAICHNDMDSKNVLWSDNRPQIIDLECLSYSNPYMEFFELALCWSGYENGHINYDLLEAFVVSYIKEYGVFNATWDTLYCSNNNRLQWLEYNVKRSLAIECNNEEERLLGIEQVKKTIKNIIFYNEIKDELLANLASIQV